MATDQDFKNIEIMINKLYTKVNAFEKEYENFHQMALSLDYLNQAFSSSRDVSISNDKSHEEQLKSHMDFINSIRKRLHDLEKSDLESKQSSSTINDHAVAIQYKINEIEKNSAKYQDVNDLKKLIEDRNGLYLNLRADHDKFREDFEKFVVGLGKVFSSFKEEINQSVMENIISLKKDIHEKVLSLSTQFRDHVVTSLNAHETLKNAFTQKLNALESSIPKVNENDKPIDQSAIRSLQLEADTISLRFGNYDIQFKNIEKKIEHIYLLLKKLELTK